MVTKKPYITSESTALSGLSIQRFNLPSKKGDATSETKALLRLIDNQISIMMW
jgi:hypothetical protein